jgi:chromate transporter
MARILRHPAWEVANVFLRLGFTAFGGPAAHIGMFRHEVVARRKWVTDEEFLDLLGATNLIPGPNSTEMAIHLGFRRAGWPGLLAGGLGFVLPATCMVLGLSWLYVRFGTTPQVGWILYGIQPVIIAILLHALWQLGRTAIKGPLTALVGVAVLGLYFLGINELAILFGGAALVTLVRNGARLRQAHGGRAILLLPLVAPSLAAAVPFSLPVLFLAFLKIGAVLYGSGYVLVAFLRADFVTRLGWLTEQQLMDAITIGQITPGPLFTSATFIGYILGGVPAALIATLGIFLPSFIFVALSNPLIPRLRRSPWTGGLLDGVIVASLGLMAAVTVQLGRTSLTDAVTIAVCLVSLFLMMRYKLNATWLIVGGAAVGLAVALIISAR